MKLHVKILKNTFSIFFVRIVSPAVTFFLLVCISRSLGPDRLGQYSVLIAFLQIVQFIPLLGLHFYIIREISKDHSLTQKYAANAVLLGAISSVFLGTGIYFVSRFLNYPTEMMNAIIIVALTILPNAAILAIESIIVGYEHMEYIALVIGSENILKVITSVIFLYMGHGIMTLMIIQLIFRVVAFFSYFIILNKLYGRISLFDFDGSLLKRFFRASPVFFGIVIFSSFINRIDFIILSKLRSFADVGLYTVAYRIFEISVILSTAFVVAFFPTMSRLHGESKERLKNLVEKSTVYLMQGIVLIVILIFIFADDFVKAFFSTQYLPAVPVLRIIITTVVFVALDQILGGLLVSSDNQKLDLKVLFIGFMNYAALLFILIPFFGIVGAAAATLLATAIQFGVRLYYTRKYLFTVSIWHNIWRQIASGILCIMISLFFFRFFWVAAVPCSTALYIGLLFLFGSIDAEEIKELIKKIKEKRAT